MSIYDLISHREGYYILMEYVCCILIWFYLICALYSLLLFDKKKNFKARWLRGLQGFFWYHNLESMACYTFVHCQSVLGDGRSTIVTPPDQKSSDYPNWQTVKSLRPQKKWNLAQNFANKTNNHKCLMLSRVHARYSFCIVSYYYFFISNSNSLSFIFTIKWMLFVLTNRQLHLIQL